MARKKTIFKEQILEGAIRLLKRDGINNLTARNIADELKCSTQPIYNEYKNMGGLREEIVKHFDDILIDKVFDHFNEKITFEKIAENYILYASEERSEEHTSELQSRFDLVCRLLLEKKNELNTRAH